VKQRKLEDLYVVGREVTLDDGRGAVTVWLQKLSPVENEAAVRAATAARARVLIAHRNPESEEYQAAYSDTVEFYDRNTMIDLIAREELGDRRMRVEAELAAEDEWAEDGYLQGLADAWRDGLSHTFGVDPDNEEAKRVFAEMRRYTEAVDAVMEGEEVAVKRDYEQRSDDELIDLTMKSLLTQRANAAFMAEYLAQELLSAVRLREDHGVRYFRGVDAIRRLAEPTRTALTNAYRELSVDPIEGKGSEEARSSSQSSEQPEPPATEEASGLRVVNP
jgi:hypothetical protein